MSMWNNPEITLPMWGEDVVALVKQGDDFYEVPVFLDDDGTGGDGSWRYLPTDGGEMVLRHDCIVAWKKS